MSFVWLLHCRLAVVFCVGRCVNRETVYTLLALLGNFNIIGINEELCWSQAWDLVIKFELLSEIHRNRQLLTS